MRTNTDPAGGPKRTRLAEVKHERDEAKARVRFLECAVADILTTRPTTTVRYDASYAGRYVTSLHVFKATGRKYGGRGTVVQRFIVDGQRDTVDLFDVDEWLGLMRRGVQECGIWNADHAKAIDEIDRAWHAAIGGES